MVTKNRSKAQKLTLSAMIIALYVTMMYFTQSFSFGAYQIRIATALKCTPCQGQIKKKGFLFSNQ